MGEVISFEDFLDRQLRRVRARLDAIEAKAAADYDEVIRAAKQKTSRKKSLHELDRDTA